MDTTSSEQDELSRLAKDSVFEMGQVLSAFSGDEMLDFNSESTMPDSINLLTSDRSSCEHYDGLFRLPFLLFDRQHSFGIFLLHYSQIANSSISKLYFKSEFMCERDG